MTELDSIPIHPDQLELDGIYSGNGQEPQYPDGIPKGKRAVAYLRVSTPKQMRQDFGPEGISVPAQRQECYRAAEKHGLTIVDEYIEPGRSAREITKRVEFQKMLERIREVKDVDAVIVYKLSRFSRNRLDDAVVAAELKQRHVKLISATESIDETPVGQLMHGLLAAFNEYRSAEDGADISYKMGQKAQSGGALGRAPIGYINTLQRVDGREVRDVTVDEERAPLIRLAFELYGDPDATLRDVLDEITHRGLTTRPTPTRPAGPINVSTLQRILQNPFYRGYVKYREELYPGRHEPLIDQQRWDKTQELMRARGYSRERRRVIQHYLKGSVHCGECWHREKRVQRLVIQRARNRHGDEYLYFFCPETKREPFRCSAKYSNVLRVEAAVAEHYRTVQVDQGFANSMREVLEKALLEDEVSQRERHSQLEKRLVQLEEQESRLIDMLADGDMPKLKVKAKLHEIERDKGRLQEELSNVVDTLTNVAEFVDVSLDLLQDAHTLYVQADDEIRRRLNQAVFTRIFINRDEVTGHELDEPFGDLLTMQTIYRSGKAGERLERTREKAIDTWGKHHPGTSPGTKKGAARMGDAFCGRLIQLNENGPDWAIFWHKPHRVETAGIEPASDLDFRGLLRV